MQRLSHMIWTIGHSNHPLDVFLEMLTSHAIEVVADVRRFPASRRHPHFNREQLNSALAEMGIEYRHFAALGGRRHQRAPNSLNQGWRVPAFNAYADHLDTAEGRAGLAELMAIASEQPSVIMCSEALPWQCHRRIVADALVAEGWRVVDIYTAKKATEHSLTEFAKVDAGRVTYPGLFAEES